MAIWRNQVKLELCKLNRWGKRTIPLILCHGWWWWWRSQLCNQFRKWNDTRREQKYHKALDISIVTGSSKNKYIALVGGRFQFIFFPTHGPFE